MDFELSAKFVLFYSRDYQMVNYLIYIDTDTM